MLMGFATGAVTGALLGVFFGNFNATNTDPNSPNYGQGGQLRIGTYLKFVPPEPGASVGSQVNFIDNTILSTPQDAANWLSNGTSAFPNGITEFISTDADGPQTLSTVLDFSTNKALLTIPMGWAPSVFVPYGGAVLLQDASMTMDQTGLMSWDQQAMTLINAAPIVGWLLGYGLLGSTQGEQDVLNWIKSNFSQNLASQ
jgi:hypothetical protein